MSEERKQQSGRCWCSRVLLSWAHVGNSSWNLWNPVPLLPHKQFLKMYLSLYKWHSRESQIVFYAGQAVCFPLGFYV